MEYVLLSIIGLLAYINYKMYKYLKEFESKTSNIILDIQNRLNRTEHKLEDLRFKAGTLSEIVHMNRSKLDGARLDREGKFI